MSEVLREALLKAGELRPVPVEARIFRRKWQTASRPALFLCSDGNEYVIKGIHGGRMIVNDQLIAHLGTALGAPVGVPTLAIIPDELKAMEQELSDVSPGISHASRFVPNTSERDDGVLCMEDGNQERFAKLAVLFGWCQSGDRQFIYLNQSPRLVFSVDHGHFFPNGPEWRLEHLNNSQPPRPDPSILGNCAVSGDMLQSACNALKSMSDETIIHCVASPPDEWGITLDERVGLVQYLINRRDSFSIQ